jgi:hypothetical protein
MKRLLLALAVMASTARAFPDAVAKGYNNCGTCHYSPLGGGPQTPYGKGTTADIWPTFRGLVLDPSEHLVYGADARRLVMTGREPLMMQQEAHLGVTDKGATIVGTVNELGPIGLWASYRYKGLGVRLGRFKPAYAIPYDDHTVRMLNNFKNAPTNNIELTAANRWGEVAVTRIAGNRFMRVGFVGRVGVGRDELAGTANLYLGKRCKSGGTVVGTAVDSVRQAWHLQCSFSKRLYGMGEWQAADRFGLIGFELFQGFHARFTSFGPDRNYRIGVRWIPIPGLEATAELEKEQAFLVTHLWF